MFRPAGGWKNYLTDLMDCNPKMWDLDTAQYRYKLKKETEMETAGTQWNYFDKDNSDRKNRPDMTKNVIIQYFDKKTKSWVDYKKNDAGEYYVDPTRWYWDIYSYNNIIRRWTYEIVEPMKFGDIVTFTETGEYTGDYNANYIIVKNDGSTYIVKRENIVKYEDRKKADIKAKIAELELAIKTHEQNIADLKLQLTSQ